MPFKKGENGGGNSSKRPFLAALTRALAQEDGKRLREAAEKLLTLASEGEEWAVKELANRMDGKAIQQTEISGPEGGPIEVSDRPVLSREEWIAAHLAGSAK